eukprot:jgi/Undpi1/10740/HiC_scaffold_29.g13188.m1
MVAERGGGGGEAGSGRERAVIEASEGMPRGPEGAIKLTYLEGNGWMCQVNGLNLLVDPVFGVLDFGVSALLQVRKKVLWDGERVTRDLAAITDFLVITQGFDDHCHPPTIQALAGLLDASVHIVAPPSAKAVLEEHFPPSRVTYILPGQSTVVSKAGRAVEVEATTGPTLGPPWQQAENGYFIRPSAAGEGVAPDGGTLYMEPHLIFDESELSKRTADVVIAPVVAQNIGPFPLVCGGAKALDLASTLKASKLVTMANGDADFSGPLKGIVTAGNTLQEFLDMAAGAGAEVVVPEVAKAISVWP